LLLRWQTSYLAFLTPQTLGYTESSLQQHPVACKLGRALNNCLKHFEKMFERLVITIQSINKERHTKLKRLLSKI